MHQQPTGELDGDLQKFETTPESRTYLHSACGKESVSSGSEFEVVCDPFSSPEMAWCDHCGLSPMKDFAWVDTGEDLIAYRGRMKEHLPESEKRAIRLMGVRLLLYLVLPVAGLVLAFALSRRNPGGASGYMVGAAMGCVLAIIVGKLIPRPTRIDFRRYV